VQINDDEYMISLAVAGFGHDNLNITKDKKTLVIEGKHSRDAVDNEDSTTKYLHKGISERSFRREFQLADHVEISNAHLELGILNVYLKREVPEEAKPKTIAITYKE
jgi:molecular chaperone IbpA